MYMTDFVNLSTSSTPGRAAAVSISERAATGPTFLSIVVSEVEGEWEEVISKQRFRIQGIGSKDLKSFIFVLYTLKKKRWVHKGFEIRKKARRYPAGAQISPSYAPSGKEPSNLVDDFAERIAILEVKVYKFCKRKEWIPTAMTGMTRIHMAHQPTARQSLFRRTQIWDHSGDRYPRTCHLFNWSTELPFIFQHHMTCLQVTKFASLWTCGYKKVQEHEFNSCI